MNPGIYIHIPFCKSRCSYCDFATDIYRDAEFVQRYVNALCKEISNSDISSEAIIDTVYFGGGTPSLLSSSQLALILDSVSEYFSVSPNAEITLEMNPGTVSSSKLTDYRKLGINRASFGVQTFDDEALKILARGHSADDARNTFDLLRSTGFKNVSLDLIGGLPAQTLDEWERNLDEALSLEPEHLSLYLLEVHENTPLAEKIRTGRQAQPDEDLAGRMYELMVDKVVPAGYEHYEISNFAKPGAVSKHNNKYWHSIPVFGFGVSAHSNDGNGRRWSNERDTSKYVELIERESGAVVTDEKLSIMQLSGEYAFLKLRLKQGLDLQEYNSRFGFDLVQKHETELRRFENLGLVSISENNLALTAKGFVFSNEVFELFI